MQVTICTANCVGQAGNCSYPNRTVVTSAEELKAAVVRDHVCAEYRENYRSNENFLRADVMVMDIDNDHSEDPVEWITPGKLSELLPDVEFLIAASRHHMLPKDGKTARPKFHVYFPIEECVDSGKYAGMKRALQKLFPFFDANALDAGRFIYGADTEEVIHQEGWMTVDEAFDLVSEDEENAAEDENFDGRNSCGPILQGSRNKTMSHFAGRILKKYGLTEKAKEAFQEHALKCEPPLSNRELKLIWGSAVKFYREKVMTQPDYVPPEEYNQEFAEAGLKPEDYSDIGEAKILVREYGNELKYTSATDFLRYDGDCW